ncbi:hypothetical protein [Roseivirga sp. E12]|uniref:hypothetical protein n=1 Tax=Roseivirga sp. E12 TaxID=2819237 RepID=UPI001ABC01CB|nr:hypothetical protein [Roseivirga sp. E12]MBO3697661.1 hypothetical protein [Roseivirga sp. E12]
MFKFIQELKRRNVIKATISYVVFSYAILQIASLLIGILELDKGINKIVLIVLIIALPLWIVFAYIYEWTPSGFKKTDSIAEEKSIHEATSKKLNHYIIAGLFLLIILLVADRVFDFTGNIVNKPDSTQVIVVLPFTSEGEDEEEFFSSGIHNDVMTRLSNIHDFRIIASSAVAEYKNYEGDLRTIGDRFDANYVLQAAVRKNGQRVRVTAALINAKNNQTAWSNVYDGELSDVFELQSDISIKIANQLEANLSEEEKDELKAFPTDNISAYEDYLLARHTVTKPNAGYDEFNQGLIILERAVAADPKFTNAWTLIAEIHSVRYDILKRDPNNQEEAEKAKEATYEAFKVAQALAPNNPDLLSTQAFIFKNIEQDPLKALSAFEKAIEQNPSDYISLKEAAFLYTFFDQPIKSKEALEKAFALTQDNGPISFQLTFAYEVLGEYEKMVPILEKLAKYYPKEKHYLVDAKYYQFLKDGKLSSFNDFKATLESTTTEFPWDERAVKNKEMVVAMFNNEFEKYHDKWEGHMASHTADGHNGWVCPMVANDNLNQARLMLTMGDPTEGQKMLNEVESIVLKPINLYSVCTFDPDIYLPKLDFLKGDTELAKQKLDEVVLRVIKNKSFPTGAVERAVLVQASDMIDPDKVYTYYKQVTDNSVSFISFEAICAEPWTYPNLIKDPRFQEEIRKDGRFVEFLSTFGFLKS